MEQKTRTGGFASMEKQKQREIARKGGMAAHRKGTAHEFTVDEARNAGRKGGNTVSANRSHMIEIGRMGGHRSAESRRQKKLARHPGDETASSLPSGNDEPVNFIQTPDMESAGGIDPVIPPSQDSAAQTSGHQTM